MKYFIKRNDNYATAAEVFGETKLKDSLPNILTSDSVTLKDLQDASCSTLKELYEKIIQNLRASTDYARYVTSNFTITKILTLNIQLKVDNRTDLAIDEYDMDVDDVVDILLLYVGYVQLSSVLNMDRWTFEYENATSIRDAEASITSKIASYIKSHIAEDIVLRFDDMTIEISETY